jgi:hypothetical protein
MRVLINNQVSRGGIDNLDVTVLGAVDNVSRSWSEGNGNSITCGAASKTVLGLGTPQLYVNVCI